MSKKTEKDLAEGVKAASKKKAKARQKRKARSKDK